MSNSTAGASAIAPAGIGGCGMSDSPTRARRSSSAACASPWEMCAASPHPKWRISLRAMQVLQPLECSIQRSPRRPADHQPAKARHAAQLLLLLERHARGAGACGLEAHLGLGPGQDALERRPVDLLAPAPHLGAARLHDAEVRADRTALVGAQQ